MSVNPIPEGYHSVTPYLMVDDAEQAIRFYSEAFGIGHAEIRIGDSMIMLADEFPDMDHLGPRSRGGPTASFLIYTADVDVAWQRAIAAGCTAEREPEDQFWGDRMGTLRDPFGHRWSLATHKEEVSPEEMQRRMQAMMAEAQPS